MTTEPRDRPRAARKPSPLATSSERSRTRKRRGVAIAAALMACVALGVWRFGISTAQPAISNGSLAGSNVLLITIDTLRADRVGAYGNTTGLTPTLDRLAESGLRFDAAFTPVPMTLPAHASILTGLQPYSHGIRNNTSFKLGQTPTLSTWLKHAGYRTGAFVGSFVLDARFGLNRDFDVYDDQYARVSEIEDFRIAERPAERVIRPATNWILQQTGSATGGGGAAPRQPQPWFAWIHVYDPHAPYHAPPPYGQGRAPYDGEVAYTDAAIGRGLDELRNAHQLDRTLIIIVGDHGESLGEHGEATHGLFAYNSTLRVPLIVSGPGIHSAIVRTPVTHVDLTPTVLDLLGITVPPGLDGRSLLNAFSGHSDESQALYFEALDANLTRGWAPLTGVIADGWKYIDLPIPELYDLEHDPGERHNVADREPERSGVMRTRTADVLGSRKAGAKAARAITDAETMARLASLGYVGSVQVTDKRAFSEADDPKSLVDLNETFNLAIGDQEEGRSESALARLLTVLKQRPDFLTARTSAAAILIGAGRPREAVALLQSASLSTAGAAVETRLGQAFAAEGNLAEAANHLEISARLRQDDVDTLNSLGVVYSRLRRFDEGRRMLRRVLELNPDGAGTWNNLGILEMNAGDRRAAAGAFRHAVNADSGYAAAWQGLGAALVGTDAAGAARAWERAVALEPRDYDTLFNLAIVLSEQPSTGEALPYLRRFVAEAPRDRYARDVAHVEAIIARIERH